MTDNVLYTVPKQIFLAETMIKKSRFLAYATCVKTADQAKEFVLGIKKKNFDATHNCYAFVADGAMKFSDDGEPNGTAGKPILNVLTSKNLTDSVVVVTRYFGGIKLGAGGLTRAYSTAALSVLNTIPLITLIRCIDLEIVAPYPLTDILISLFKKYNCRFSCLYDADVIFKVTAAAEILPHIKSAVLDATNGKVNIIEGQPYLGEIS
jgi:uncharacterized YigZ family protein